MIAQSELSYVPVTAAADMTCYCRSAFISLSLLTSCTCLRNEHCVSYTIHRHISPRNPLSTRSARCSENTADFARKRWMPPYIVFKALSLIRSSRTSVQLQ